MSVNTERFVIAKDLGEWLNEIENAPWGNIAGSDERTWKYDYSGKRELLPYMHLYEQDIEAFAKYYPDMDIWLKNIHWNPLFESAISILQRVLSEVEKNPGLILIHASPLELAIMGEFIKKYITGDVIYNFNRIPAVNSVSKTLEACLFTIGWENIDWLVKRMDGLRKAISDEKISKAIQESIILLDENDTPPQWDISHIDPYVKSAIGWKENIVTYKVNDLPDAKFLFEHNIRDVYLFDQDASGGIDQYYTKKLGDAFTFHKIQIPTSSSTSIGYYEDYVVTKNTEYLNYRKTLLATTEKNRGTSLLTGGGGTEKYKGKKSSSTSIWTAISPPLDKTEATLTLAGLGGMLTIFIALASSNGNFFTQVLSGLSDKAINPSSSSNTIRGSSSWGSSFKSSMSSSSNSSISSFGGGGFSKSSGG